MQKESAATNAVNFENTALAFAHLNDDELKRQHRLFRLIDNPFLTKVGPPLATTALKMRLPVTGLIRQTVFDIFCGGESLAETRKRSDDLFKNKVMTILDYSVEGEKNDAGFDETRDEVKRTLHHGSGYDAVAFSAMKVTGIAHFDILVKAAAGEKLSPAEQVSFDRSKARFNDLCDTAGELQQPLFVDAEETWIQDVIDTWTEELMEKHNQKRAIIVQTVQMYRKSGLPYLEGLIERAREKGYIIGLKLVRGAYLEKERKRAEEMGYDDPIQDNKLSTDIDFNTALQLCMDNIDVVEVCIATHNQVSCGHAAKLMAERDLPPNHSNILFAQLLGMSDNISFNLSQNGYQVAKYLPYGPVKSVLPYLIRRAQENTSVAGQAGREVELLTREVNRRRGK